MPACEKDGYFLARFSCLTGADAQTAPLCRSLVSPVLSLDPRGSNSLEECALGEEKENEYRQGKDYRGCQ